MTNDDTTPLPPTEGGSSGADAAPGAGPDPAPGTGPDPAPDPAPDAAAGGGSAPGAGGAGYGGQPTPPPYPYGPRPPLRRSRTDRKIAGVAGGLGRHFDVDPLIIRVVLVVLALFGGSGLLLYGLGWLLIPAEGTDRSEADRLLHTRGSGSSIPPVVLAVIGAIAVVGLLTYGPGRAALAVLVVVAVVMAMSTRSRREGRGPWAPPPGGWQQQPGSWEQPPGAWEQPPGAWAPTGAPEQPAAAGSAPSGVGAEPGWSTWGSGGTATATAPVYTPPYAAPYSPPPSGSAWGYEPPTPPAPPSPLGRITMSAALLVAGLVVAGQAIAGHHVDVVPVLAAVLAVLATGLVVGTFWGRARWLVLPAALVAVVLVVAANVPHLPPGGIGQRIYTPESVAAVQSPYQLGIGELQLDLTGVDPAPGQTVDVTAEVGIGHLLVTVDSQDTMVLTARATNGEVDVDGVRQQGHDVRVSRTLVGTPTGAGGTVTGTPSTQPGTIVLHLKAGLGQVEVHHEAA